MKTIITLLLFLSFSVEDYGLYSDKNAPVSNKIQNTPCPKSHEKAEEDVKDYLKKEQTLTELKTKYGLEVDSTSHEDVYALENESDSVECQRLIDNFEWLVEDSQYSYSIYKVADHYFIVQYKISENNKYKRNSISINNSELELIAVVIDFG